MECMEWLFLFLALLSEVIGTTIGFGSSTILLPLALFFFDFKLALVLVGIFHIFGNISRISLFRKIDKRMLLAFGLPSVIFTAVGALLVNYANQELLKMVLGVFLVCYSLFSLSKRQLNISSSSKNKVMGGALSGFFAGLIGTGGAVRGAFLTSFGMKKANYISTAASIALLVDLTRVPLYISSGFLAQSEYYQIPFLLATAIVGSFIGKRIVDKINQKLFRKIVLIGICIAAVGFIVGFFV